MAWAGYVVVLNWPDAVTAEEVDAWAIKLPMLRQLTSYSKAMILWGC